MISNDLGMEELQKSPFWHALYTRGRHEKKVADRLEARGLEVYLPLIPRESQWHDRKKIVLWPLFPSYVFARFEAEAHGLVRATPGLVSVVAINGVPATIGDDEIDNIRLLVDAIVRTGSPPRTEGLIRAGENVRVKDGPFRGVHGTVLERRGGRVTLQVGLSAIKQGIRLEASEDDVQIAATVPRSS